MSIPEPVDLFDSDLTVAQVLALAGICGVVALCVWDGMTAVENPWRIANRITLPAIVAGTLAAPLLWDVWGAHLLAGAVGFVVLAGVSLRWPAVVGVGPAKLVAAIGVVVGPAVGVVVLLAVVTATADAYVAERSGRIVGMAPHFLAATALVVAAALVA